VSDFDSQFALERDYYLEHLDFINWYRYGVIVRAVLADRPRSILEIGGGDGLLRGCLQTVVPRYETVDLNPRLRPEHVADVRALPEAVRGEFDCVIAADILEHLPFEDLGLALQSLKGSLTPGGRLLVTIPHRRSNFLWMSPAQRPRVFTVPTGFLSPGSFYRRFVKRKIWIDPHHCWEIGDGHHTPADVVKVFEDNGLVLEKVEKLIYVDYFTLRAA
jgi:SAM-dependent methyltransferase